MFALPENAVTRVEAEAFLFRSFWSRKRTHTSLSVAGVRDARDAGAVVRSAALGRGGRAAPHHVPLTPRAFSRQEELSRLSLSAFSVHELSAVCVFHISLCVCRNRVAPKRRALTLSSTLIDSHRTLSQLQPLPANASAGRAGSRGADGPPGGPSAVVGARGRARRDAAGRVAHGARPTLRSAQ